MISPINKATTYHKEKKNSILLKTKKIAHHKDSVGKNKTAFASNNYYVNYNRNGLLSEYCTNASLIDRIQRPDLIINNSKNKPNVIIDIKPYKIVKSNSNSCINKRDSYYSTNALDYNSKRDMFGNSLSYISPKSIEKYKYNYHNQI